VHRGLSAQVVKHNEHRFLIDCGEGTQRQILRSGIGFKRLNRILITHGHLDHILGLAGLFSTFSRWEAMDEVEIYGGKWALERVKQLLYGVRVIPRNDSGMAVHLIEVEPGVIIEEEDFSVQAFPVEHRGPDCYGYLFAEKPHRPFLAEKAEALGVPNGPQRRDLVNGQPITLEDGRLIDPLEVLGPARPGTRLAHTGDLGSTEELVEICRGLDLLICEATYLQSEREMAAEFSHLTAQQAAELARDAGIGQLVLTHVSRRYRERDIIEEARSVFSDAYVARDFDTFQVKRGETIKVTE
jgi:ribonuclease Z